MKRKIKHIIIKTRVDLDHDGIPDEITVYERKGKYSKSTVKVANVKLSSLMKKREKLKKKHTHLKKRLAKAKTKTEKKKIKRHIDMIARQIKEIEIQIDAARKLGLGKKVKSLICKLNALKRKKKKK